MSSSTLGEAEEKIEDMTRRLDEEGKKSIEYAVPGRIYMGKSDENAKEQVKKLVGENRSLLKDTIAKGFVGSPDTIAERMHRLSELGFDYIILQPSPALKTLNEVEEKLIKRL